jgi:acetyltransferase-like isoleucine patch superfamily enzyme
LTNGVVFGKKLKCHGLPLINISLDSSAEFGNNITINSGNRYNWCGRSQHTKIYVSNHGKLIIGSNVGLSSVSIWCESEIIIEDFVLIGNDVCIYDSDFHSLNFLDRRTSLLDKANTVRKNILIKKSAFIGAHSTILKGVVIGENSIIGACSTVTKSVPNNEIWGGNPAKFIKRCNPENEEANH